VAEPFDLPFTESGIYIFLKLKPTKIV